MHIPLAEVYIWCIGNICTENVGHMIPDLVPFRVHGNGILTVDDELQTLDKLVRARRALSSLTLTTMR